MSVSNPTDNSEEKQPKTGALQYVPIYKMKTSIWGAPQAQAEDSTTRRNSITRKTEEIDLDHRYPTNHTDENFWKVQRVGIASL